MGNRKLNNNVRAAIITGAKDLFRHSMMTKLVSDVPYAKSDIPDFSYKQLTTVIAITGVYSLNAILMYFVIYKFALFGGTAIEKMAPRKQQGKSPVKPNTSTVEACDKVGKVKNGRVSKQCTSKQTSAKLKDTYKQSLPKLNRTASKNNNRRRLPPTRRRHKTNTIQESSEDEDTFDPEMIIEDAIPTDSENSSDSDEETLGDIVSEHPQVLTNKAKHILGKLNHLPDLSSRLQIVQFKAAAPHMDKDPTDVESIVLDLCIVCNFNLVRFKHDQDDYASRSLTVEPKLSDDSTSSESSNGAGPDLDDRTLCVSSTSSNPESDLQKLSDDSINESSADPGLDEPQLNDDKRYSESTTGANPNLADKNAWRHCIETKDEQLAKELVKGDNLPQDVELEEACTIFGVISSIMQQIFRSIEDKITALSSSIVYTQACHLAKPSGNIVFVAFTEGVYPDIYYMPYRVLVRKMTDCSGEANTIIEKEVADNKPFCQHDIEKIACCLRHHSPRLMEEHSNLTMTSASRYKCKYYDSHTLETKLEPEPCIVFYVQAKGLIPVGEKLLPDTLTIGDTTFKTDVREGGRVSFAVGGRPTEKHQNLKVGCRITSKDGAGTIGGFVNHPKYGFCAVTCAHVLLSGEEMIDYKKGKKVKVKRNCYQPSEPDKCGQLLEIMLRGGDANTTGLDVAFVKVDDDRQPISGDFPDYSFKDWAGTCGYCKDGLFKAQLAYNSGAVLSKHVLSSDTKVVKYGQKTMLTEGKLQICGGSSAPEIIINTEGKTKRKTFVFHDQFHIFDIYHAFCTNGDSGSLIFSRGSDNNLSAIGILIGKSNSIKVSYATPLSSILREIGQQDPFSLVSFDPNQRLENKINKTYSEVKNILETHSTRISDVHNAVQELKDEMKTTSENQIKEIKSMFEELKPKVD
ncbi:uncharacterized protein LOC123526657 [Mercenaria mercenaria]|uniref:uncharacterized protein LOC123526657 n=1 Tax=Mercenaria mercenaria TaxID=6596 RepID=UPI00234F148F|nr:uncharacterized protein LOC123526657 [Mercenaria mercenaria]